MIEIPNLKIDRDGDDEDALVCLQQESLEGAGHQAIYLHPTQVRLVAERMGLLAPSSNIEADRTIVRLCRQMRTLLGRIEYLDDWLHTCSDTAHADLDYEQTYSQATWEMALEFVADLPVPAPATAAVDRQSEAGSRDTAGAAAPAPVVTGPHAGLSDGEHSTEPPSQVNGQLQLEGAVP